MHDRLVAHVDRAQPIACQSSQVLARHAERSDAPGVRMAVLREAGEQRGRSRRIPDGIP